MQAPVYGFWLGLALLLAAGCTKEEPGGWPELPRDSRRARELVDEHTHRSVGAASTPLTADGILALLGARVEQGRLVGGMDGIVFWIWRRVSAAERSGRSSFILWGTYHDSITQVRAFGELVGPLGLARLDAVVVEQFNADGRWGGVSLREQAGDSALLADYRETGGRVVLEKLLHVQVRENYTAWKYGLLPAMMELLIKARAAGRGLCGCDMSVSLQERIHEIGMTDRLRELHCVLSMQRELGGRPAPHRVAMLWGQGHLAPEGVQRFLPKNALVLSFYVFGGRFSRRGLEADLQGRLAVTDPLMIPVDASGNLIVLLPDDRIGARKELKHMPPEAPLAGEKHRRLVVTGSRPGTLQVGKQNIEVSEEPQELRLSKGAHVFIFAHPDGLLAGTLTMPPDGFLELDLQPERRFVEVTLHRRTR
jgi:hypothetical protein